MAYAADYTKDSGAYNVGRKILDEEITLVRYVDTSTRNLASGSFYKLFAVPANFSVNEVYVVTGTGEGATATIDITDDDVVTTTFVNDTSVQTAGVIGKGTARKVYSSAGFICVLANHTLDAAGFWVIVLGQILNDKM
jgi:hypothetical protein